MRGRYRDVRFGNFHQIAAFHHKVKADTYAQIGFGEKAASHRRRATWHAAFGTPTAQTEEAKALHAQFLPNIREKFDDVSANIESIMKLTNEIAKYIKKEDKDKEGTGHSAKTIKKEDEDKKGTGHSAETIEKEDEGKEGKEGTKHSEKTVETYHAARLATKVKEAGRSVGEFAKSFRSYLNALKARDRTKGGDFYTEYDNVGGLINTLIRSWLSTIKAHTEISKADFTGDTEMNVIIGLLMRTSIGDDANTNRPSGARVPPEVSQIKATIHDTFAVGAATLLGVRRAHNSNLECARTKDIVPDRPFQLYYPGEDD